MIKVKFIKLNKHVFFLDKNTVKYGTISNVSKLKDDIIYKIESCKDHLIHACHSSFVFKSKKKILKYIRKYINDLNNDHDEENQETKIS